MYERSVDPITGMHEFIKIFLRFAWHYSMHARKPCFPRTRIDLCPRLWPRLSVIRQLGELLD